ncbi:MAG: glycosyltransferase family 2 protein [Rikenellaceae bacterium]
MKAAVVILNWNGAHHLREFLPSVIAHTPADIDIVVADNGSTDDSIATIEAIFAHRVKLHKMDKNRGYAGGYNKVLSELNHDIFILLNSDIEVTAGWCEPLVERLKNDPKIGAVGSKLRSYVERDKFEYAGAAGGFIDYLGYPFCRGRIASKIEQDKGQYDNADSEVFWVSGAAMACRSEVFKELGGFDEDFFAHMEEIDLCWRMQLRGYKIVVACESVIYHLGGGTLNTESPRKTYLNHRNNLAMLYKCAPPMQRFTVAAVRPFLDIAAAFSYLFQGRFGSFLAVGHAWFTFLMWHSKLNRKRKEIRSAVVAESNKIYRGSILIRSILFLRRS